MLGSNKISAVLALAVTAGSVNAQSAVSSAVFNNIQRYTQFASASYQDDCASPPFGSSIVKTFSDSATDTQATLFRDDTAKEVIIAFRGTSTPADLDADLQFDLVALTATGTSCSNCQVHHGFQSGYGSLSSAISSAIKSQLSSNSGYKLIVTGHSLGGGLAAIATSSLIGQGIKVGSTYTFGEPRNGDSNWVSYITSQISSNYYRVTHSFDGVPQIPPTVLGYAHHHSEYFQSQQDGNTAATTLKFPVDSTGGNAGQDFGNSPINKAHVTYSNGVLGSSLFNVACGAVFPS